LLGGSSNPHKQPTSSSAPRPDGNHRAGYQYPAPADNGAAQPTPGGAQPTPAGPPAGPSGKGSAAHAEHTPPNTPSNNNTPDPHTSHTPKPHHTPTPPNTATPQNTKPHPSPNPLGPGAGHDDTRRTAPAASGGSLER
jgi:hypothetical protein